MAGIGNNAPGLEKAHKRHTVQEHIRGRPSAITSVRVGKMGRASHPVHAASQCHAALAYLPCLLSTGQSRGRGRECSDEASICTPASPVPWLLELA